MQRRKAMTNLNVEILELTIDELQEVSGGTKIDPRGYGPASAYRFAQGAPADIQWVLDGLPPRPV
jgi:bacteriocin-like protein